MCLANITEKRVLKRRGKFRDFPPQTPIYPGRDNTPIRREEKEQSKKVLLARKNKKKRTEIRKLGQVLINVESERIIAS